MFPYEAVKYVNPNANRLPDLAIWAILEVYVVVVISTKQITLYKPRAISGAALLNALMPECVTDDEKYSADSDKFETVNGRFR